MDTYLNFKMTLCTIVGMGPGIGYSLAKKFGSQGFEIGMIARNENHLQQLELSLWEQGISSSYAVADAGNCTQLQAALHKVGSNLDVLIYNAAVVEKSTIDTLSAEKLVEDFRVNVTGALVAVQHVLPHMLHAGGTILFTGGSFAHMPNPNYTSLSVGKAGLHNLAACLSKEYEPQGIHIAIVSVWGKVAAGTRYDPDLIAQEFWKLYAQPKRKWEREVQVR